MGVCKILYIFVWYMSEPLAERLRPRTLDEYVGQKHLVGEGAVLRKMIDAGRISSFILWGPPGVGKTDPDGADGAVSNGRNEGICACSAR